MQPNIFDPFFLQLYKRLAEAIEDRAQGIINGGSVCIIDGVDHTGIKYRESVAYIQALQQAIELGIEIDNERHGVKKRDEE